MWTCGVVLLQGATDEPMVTEDEPIVTEGEPIVTEDEPIVTENEPIVTENEETNGMKTGRFSVRATLSFCNIHSG